MLRYRQRLVMMEEYALEYINHEVLCKRSTYRADKYKYLLAYQELAKKLAIPPLYARSLERKFRKYFFTKMKAMVREGLTDISQMPEEPRWMRLVEEKLNTLPTLLQDLNRRRPAKGTSPDEVVSALCMQATLRGTLCARDMYGSVARDLRLCARVSDLHAVWVSAQRVSLRYLSISSRAGDAADSALSLSHAQVADLVLLHTDVDTLHLVTDESDNIEAESKALAVLWRLVERHRVEERAPPHSRVRAQRWTRAYHDYLASNRLATLVVLQRRWHELKLRARARALARHRAVHADRLAHGHAPPLTDLDVAILKKYPHIMTSPLASWLTLVRRGSVITQLLSDVESDQDSDECDKQVYPEDAAKPTAKLDPKQVNHPSKTKPAVSAGRDAMVSGHKDIPYNEIRDITDVLNTIDPSKVTTEVFIESDTENATPDAVHKIENGRYDEDSKVDICVKEAPRTMANRIVFADDNDITIQEIDDEIIEGNFDTQLLMDTRVELTRVQDTPAWRQYSKEDKYINASYFTIDDVSIKSEAEDVDSDVTESKMAIIFEDDSDVVDSDYEDEVPAKIPRLNSAGVPGEPQATCPDLESQNAGQNSDAGKQKSGETQAQKIGDDYEVMDSDDVATIANNEIRSMSDLAMLLAELPTAGKVEQVSTSGIEYCCPARKHTEISDNQQSLGLPPLPTHTHDNGPCACCCGNLCDQSARQQADVDLKALKNDIAAILKLSVIRKEKRARRNPRPPRKKPNKTVKKNNKNSSTEETAVISVAAAVPKTTESVANTTLTDKTKSQSTKNPTLEGAKKASSSSLEGYDEWIRQKNVNTQFFLLQGVNKKDKANTATIPTEVTPAPENTSYKTPKSYLRLSSQENDANVLQNEAQHFEVNKIQYNANIQQSEVNKIQNETITQNNEENKHCNQITEANDIPVSIKQRIPRSPCKKPNKTVKRNNEKSSTEGTVVTSVAASVPKTTESVENTTLTDKTKSQSTKNSTLEGAKKASTSSLEGYDEWIRQKNVHTQFFLLQGVNKKDKANTATIPTEVTHAPENTSYKTPKSYLRLSSQENDANVLQNEAQNFEVNKMQYNANIQQSEVNKIQNETITQNNEENKHCNQITEANDIPVSIKQRIPRSPCKKPNKTVKKNNEKSSTEGTVVTSVAASVPKTTESVENTTLTDKTKSQSTKNPTLEGAKKASTSSLEGYDEWIRQKNVNTQFFLLQGVKKKDKANTATIPTEVTHAPENTSYKTPKSYLRLSSQENDANVLQNEAQNFEVNKMQNNAITQLFEGNKIHNNGFTQQFEVNNIQNNAITQHFAANKIQNKANIQQFEVNKMQYNANIQKFEVNKIQNEAITQNNEENRHRNQITKANDIPVKIGDTSICLAKQQNEIIEPDNITVNIGETSISASEKNINLLQKLYTHVINRREEQNDKVIISNRRDEQDDIIIISDEDSREETEEIPEEIQASAKETQVLAEKTQALEDETQALEEETQAPAEVTQAHAEETVAPYTSESIFPEVCIYIRKNCRMATNKLLELNNAYKNAFEVAPTTNMQSLMAPNIIDSRGESLSINRKEVFSTSKQTQKNIVLVAPTISRKPSVCQAPTTYDTSERPRQEPFYQDGISGQSATNNGRNPNYLMVLPYIVPKPADKQISPNELDYPRVVPFIQRESNNAQRSCKMCSTLPGDQIREQLVLPERTGGQSASTTSDNPIPLQLSQPETTTSNQSSLICSTKSGDSIVTPNVQPAPISGQTPPTTSINPMPVPFIRQETSIEKNCLENCNTTSGNLITPPVLPEPTIGQTTPTKLTRVPFVRRDIIGQRTSSIRNTSGNQYMAHMNKCIQPEPTSGQIVPIERNSSIPVLYKRRYNIGPRTLLIRSTSNNRIITPLSTIPPEPTSGQATSIESNNLITVPFNRRENVTGARRSLIRSSISSNRFMAPLMQPEPTSGQTAPTESNNSILVPLNRRANIIGPRRSPIRSTTSGNVYTRSPMLSQPISGQTASTEYNNQLPASAPLIWRETILGQKCSSINSASSDNKEVPPMESNTIGEQTSPTKSNNSTRVPFIRRKNIIELKSSSIRSTPSGNLFILPPEATSEPITPTKSNNPIPMHYIWRHTAPGKKTFTPSTNNFIVVPFILQETTDSQDTDTISNNSLVPASTNALISPTNHSVDSNTGTAASVDPPKIISERNVATDCRTNLDDSTETLVVEALPKPEESGRQIIVTNPRKVKPAPLLIPESISMQNDLTNNSPESNIVPPGIDMLQNSNVELQSPNECATKSKPSIPLSKSIKTLSSITLNQNTGPRSLLNKPSSCHKNTQSSMTKDERKSDKESPTRAKGVIVVNKLALNKIITPKEARSSKSKTQSSAVPLLYNDADTMEADNSVQETITLNSNSSNYDEEHDEWLKHKNEQFFKPPMEDITVTMKTKKRKHHDKKKKKSKRKEKIKKHKIKKYKYGKETTEVMTDSGTSVESDTAILDAPVENQMLTLREIPLPSEEIESETPMHNALVTNKSSYQEKKTPHREMQLHLDRLQIERKISVHDTISSSDDGATPSKIPRPNSDCKIFSFCSNEPSVHNETILHDIQDNHKIEAESPINYLQAASAETDHNSMDCSEMLLHTKTDSRKIQLDSQSDRSELVSYDLPFCSETSYYSQTPLHEAYQREMIYNERCLNELPLLMLPPPPTPPPLPPLPASPSPQDAQELAETLEESAPLGKTEAYPAEVNNNESLLTPITNNNDIMVDKYSYNNETNESLTELTPTNPLHIDIPAPNDSQVVLRDYSDCEDISQPPQPLYIDIPSVTTAEDMEDSVFTTDDLYQKPSSDLSHHRLSTEYQIPTVIVGEYRNAKSNAVQSPKALRQSKTLVQNSLYFQIPRENIKHSSKYKHKTFEQSDAHYRREHNFSTMLSPDKLRQTHIDVQIVGQYPSKPPKKRSYPHTIVSEQNEPTTGTDPENNSDRIILENNDRQSETLNLFGERNDSVPELHIAPPGMAFAQTMLPKKDIRLSKDLDNPAECVTSKDIHDGLADKAASTFSDMLLKVTNTDSPICTLTKDFFTPSSRDNSLKGTLNTVSPKDINFNTISVLPKDENSHVIDNLASSSGHVTPTEHLNTDFPKDMSSPIPENNNNEITNYSAYSTNFNITQKIHTSDSGFSTPIAKDLYWLKEMNLTKVPVERNRKHVRKVQRRIADGIRKSSLYMIPSSSPGKNNIINAPQTDANVPQSIDSIEQADLALLDPVRLIIPPTKSETHQSDIEKSDSSTNVNKSTVLKTAKKRKRNYRILRKASKMCSPNQTGPSSETSGKLLQDVPVIPDAIVAEIKKSTKLKPKFNTKVSRKVYTVRHKCKEQKRHSFQSLSPVGHNKAVEMPVVKFKLRKDWYNNFLSKPTGSKLRSVPNLVYPLLSRIISPPFSKNLSQSNEGSLEPPPKLCLSNLQSCLMAWSPVSEESTQNSIEERQQFDASREEISLESPKESTHTENVVTSTLSQHTSEIGETEKSEASHKMVDETDKIDTPTTSFLLPRNAEELVQQNEARCAVTPRDDSFNNGNVKTLTECYNIEADFIGKKQKSPRQCKEQHYVKRKAKQIQKKKLTKKQTTIEEKVEPTTKVNYKNLPIRKRPYIQPEQNATKSKDNVKREMTKRIRAQSTVARQSQEKYIRTNHRKQDTLRLTPLDGARLKNLDPVATTSLAEVPSMDEVDKTIKRLPSVDGTSEWYSEIRTLVESPILPKLRIRVIQKSDINQTEEATTATISKEVVAQPDDTTLMSDIEIDEIPLPEVEPPTIDVSLNDIPLPIEQPPVEVILLSCVGLQDSDTLVSKIPKIDMECVADVLSTESQPAQSPESWYHRLAQHSWWNSFITKNDKKIHHRFVHL